MEEIFPHNNQLKNRKKILLVFGTRPEAIKMAPVVYELQKYQDELEIRICVTAQHGEMLDQILEFFRIEPNYNLHLMKPNQSLFYITTNGLKKLEKILNEYRPNLIFVQGDTTTTFIGALAGFYKKVKIGHIEAGLRSFNKFSPFPEEINRILTDHIVDYHFAPTQKAKKNLLNEGIKENVWVVGNTVVDALLLGLKIINKKEESEYLEYFKFMDFSKKIILVTVHRRENFGERFQQICTALQEIATEFANVEIIYPVHLNPNINGPAQNLLRGFTNIHLAKPLPYQYLIWLMNKSHLILTDSGGIQEEATSLGKPVLVLRDVTERIEGVEAGTAKLVGTTTEKIIEATYELLTNKRIYNKMSKISNLYGDGKASNRIVKILKRVL